MNVSIVLLGLQSLYDALNGRHWVYTGTGAEWSFDNLTVNPCEPPWQFLKCDDNGLLYDIIIKECNATGKLSDASGFFNNAYMQENLTSLLLHTSNITGTIPTSMYQLTALTRIELFYNQLSGTIPTMYMENLKNLNYISMNNNKLTGTFPAAFNSLVKLSTIILSSNFLTGSIPTITLNNLEVLNLGNNSFSSTLPVIHSSILKELVLSNNSFSGKLNPDTIGGMESLTLLLLFKNKLTSSLPEQLGFLTSLTTLSLSNNQLTGNVDILANLKKLEELRLSYNQFTGEIPRLEDAISLRILDLTDNNFRGRISSSLFSAMLNLQNVSLSFNQFSGPFPNLTANENLISVDVIGNQFTGFIPASLFESNTNLLTFAASKNCLHRKIPDSICGADSLEELLLSGLHQAQCSFNVFLGSIINPVAIPDCIWSMKNIRQLYLDGNGYAAMLTMHETDFQMKNLTHFSIGYNRIRGELPAQLDNRKMEVFNIANNAITGSLNDVHIIPSNIFTSEFKADLNRYSGELDLSILESYQQQIDVLNGNLIACGFQPTNDFNYSSYSCGTQNFNYSIYLWIFSLVVSLLLYCIIVKSEHPYIKQLYSKYIQQNSISKMSSDYVKENFPCTLQFLSSLERLATGSVAIVMFQVITTVIIYVALKEGPERYHYRTLTHQYWLTISGVFLRGWQPAVVMICIHHLVVLLLIGILFHCFISNWNLMKFHDGRKRRELIQKSLTTWQKCWEISWKERFDQMQKTIYRVFVIGTFISFSCGANVLYIYQKKDLEGVKLILLQLFVALYYNIARFLIPTISSHLYHTQEDDVGLVTTTSMIITSINLVVIDVMIPFIATLFSDDLCFAQVVNGIPPINSMITDSSCLAYYNQTTQCAVVSDSSVTLDFYPDFIYSNQCRDAVMISFLPVVIVACAIESFGIPVLYCILTMDVEDISEPLKIFNGLIAMNNTETIILSDVPYSMMKIYVCFLLLLVYGTYSPIASFTIGITILSRIYLLQFRIRRYYNLKYANKEMGRREKNVTNFLDTMCMNAKTSYEYCWFWGLSISSFIFAAYMLDMTSDVEYPNFSLGFMLFFACISISPLSYYSFSHVKRRQDSRLESNLLSVMAPFSHNYERSEAKDKDEAVKNSTISMFKKPSDKYVFM